MIYIILVAVGPGGFPIYCFCQGLLFYLVIALGPSLATSVYSFTDATGLRRACQLGWAGQLQRISLHGSGSQGQPERPRADPGFLLLCNHDPICVGLACCGNHQSELKGTEFLPNPVLHAGDPGRGHPGFDLVTFPFPLGRPNGKNPGVFRHPLEFLGGQPTEAFAWVIAIQIWANMGTTMIIFLAGLQTIPSELYEAARIDGASSGRYFPMLPGRS